MNEHLFEYHNKKIVGSITLHGYKCVKCGHTIAVQEELLNENVDNHIVMKPCISQIKLK